MSSIMTRLAGHMNRTRLLIILGLLLLIVVATTAILLQRSPEPREPLAPSAQPPLAQEPSAEEPAAPDVQRLSEREQLARAFEAAFGRRTSARVEVKDEGRDDAELVEFSPGGLFWTGLGPVLISEGQAIDASHASAGRIAVHYLEPAGDGFRVVRSVVPAVTTGSFGHVGSWRIRDDLAGYPVLQAEGGGTWQGYTCSYATLAELKPDGVTELARFPAHYSDAGAVIRGRPIEIEGQLTNVVKDRSFDVTYSGSRSFVDHYERRGESYVLAGGKTRMEEC